MHLGRVEEAQSYASATLVSLARHEVSPTPHNFAIWYEYHAGQNPNLSATIDIIESNHRPFDEKVLSELYEGFFTSTKEELALHGISGQVQDTLHEVLNLVDNARADATRYGITLSDVSGQLITKAGALAHLIHGVSRFDDITL